MKVVKFRHCIICFFLSALVFFQSSAVTSSAGEVAKPSSAANSLISGDAAEDNLASWVVSSEQPGDKNTLSMDTGLAKVGKKSLKLCTTGGFDVCMLYPRSKDLNLDLTEYGYISAWFYAKNKNIGFQNNSPSIRLCGETGYIEYKADGEILNRANGKWCNFQIPLAGDGIWKASKNGHVSLDDIDWIEIHADTWDYGFQLWIDGLKFSKTADHIISKDSPVLFNDSNIEAAVRLAINKPSGVLWQEDADRVTSLHLNGKGIKDIGVLKRFVHLRSLRLSNNAITDITPLSGLIELRSLYLNINMIEDVSALKKLKNLTVLHLNTNRIKSAEPLAGLTNLTDLQLLDNPSLTSIGSIKNLTKLTKLSFTNNSASDVGFLKKLTSLKELKLTGLRISSLEPAKGLKKLEVLEVESTRVTNMDLLKEFKNLKHLRLCYNNIADLSALKSLNKLELFILFENKITSVDAILNLSRMKILDLGPVPKINIDRYKNVKTFSWAGANGYKTAKELMAKADEIT